MSLTGPDYSKASYWTEFDEHGERIVMPMRRSWKVVVWALAGFAFVALQHFDSATRDFDALDIIVAALLLIGFLHLLLNALTSLLAREVVCVQNGELIHGWRLLGLRREKRYKLANIRCLAADRDISLPKDDQLLSVFKDFGKIGRVNFDYSDTTVGMGTALDQAHAQQVVNWIARRAPRSVLDY